MTRRKDDQGKQKPGKPRKDFPLFPHACGQWAKKVGGKLFYFGPWEDPDAAEKDWDAKKQAILDGRNPSSQSAGDTVKWLCDTFMDSRQKMLDRGELSKRALNDYHKMVKHVAKFWGNNRRLETIRAVEFSDYKAALPKHWSPTTTNNALRLVRVLFRYSNLIEATERPIRYEQGLKAVSKTVARKHAAEQPAKEFALADVHKLLDKANVMMRAFIYLGLNCAYGTADIGRLKRSDIDWDNQWLGKIRGKTGIARGCWLWPETIEAVQAAVEASPPPRSDKHAELAFLTRQREPWWNDGGTSHPLCLAFNKLKKDAKVGGKGVGHYSLRHTFETVAGDAKDQIAVDFVMGHHDQSMAGVYREGIDPERVKAVCQFVRQKFLEAKPKPEENAKQDEVAA